MNIDELKVYLEKIGIHGLENIYWNLQTAPLYEQIIRRREAHIAHLGALVVKTGYHTGRSPDDKFTVEEPSSADKIWWGKVNRPYPADQFDALFKNIAIYLEGREIFVQDCLVGADPETQIPIRVITEDAWHSLFARTMFLRPDNFDIKIAVDEPEFTIVHVPHFHAMPSMNATHSEAFVIVNFAKKIVLIGGTSYAGEIKKSIFYAMNYLLPQQNILTMHASANVGEQGDTAIFFGLSGTGKTTLSADPSRGLIGDDEHGWDDNGVFNLEGGCYAKVIKLSKEREPLIYETTRRFGTILENVSMDIDNRRLDLDDDSFTENTRAAYPITHIPNAILPSMAGHPKNIIMLTCDAFGVLPPISKLTPEQAMYHFLSGYTAKVAGTERGITEPQATFSTCFGAPFMALNPTAYADLLGSKIKQHGVQCWLINTGWSGGPYGIGERMDIHHTRAMLNAALNGQLDDVEFSEDPYFHIGIPKSCPGVPNEVLNPVNLWKNPEHYKEKATELVHAFQANFKMFDNQVSADIANAGPQ